jgi:hypothetical protein
MAMSELGLEGMVRVGTLDVYPIVWTVVRRDVSARGLSMVMCREAFGVVVRRDEGARAYLVDGRVLTVEDLALEHPSLADGLATIS